MADKGDRIAKVLARAGLCSRREAERWISDGRIAVNGKVLDTPAFVVNDGDIVTVDGKPLPEKPETRLWRYHKPVGQVTTHSDPEGRPTVFASLPPELGRVISVGRLDLNSEGLLLLTNDGELARHLELPSTGWVRRYRVRVYGTVNDHKLNKMANGVTVEGVRYGSIKATLDSTQRNNSWLTVSLEEGKNREIRKVMEHFDLKVSRLIRIAYGPFQLGTLKSGETDEIRGNVLRDQLGSDKGQDKGTGTAKARPKNPTRRDTTKRDTTKRNADRRRKA
ncbi:MAG: rRNA pseudouridine synthase [Rhodospirillales bacterium]|nr:rRNA pseudouridine synthase [Rhodospirillales bacterium]MCW8862255.1 rRNA pseudouridine synthase [Rhodospirillales bacterium]MCW8953220.1 rRNA pseudouridine synthase [Rhodospirillales bacterium]MCW8970068.1 rRNA pseudouridine synthase [Rhodospirillales bacterium]MCW9001693.1 rRNA pseudouridine synthase [Rhodospirillales bacterium]